MWQAVGHLLPIAVAVAVSSVPIMVMIMILLSPKRKLVGAGIPVRMGDRDCARGLSVRTRSSSTA